MLSAEQKARIVELLGSLTKDQWLEILQSLELRAHFYTIRGTSHQNDIFDIYELARTIVNAEFGTDIQPLKVTDHTVIIRPPRRGL